ncbi:hypothetical protein HYQ15_gp50 [Lactococcus phage CHPC958]|uniref:Uncharacterized protein n=1 Tax=Lactococcus phage CHPC958 TaxID=2675254 RepID=A0A650ETH1_9CAUD|nr:hypothetical protein HYQ15_gp50 [Lactococcus phage CHPC958]QGT53226.1 hypothetical protein CHPC958_000886 [Lactococcus phage CHPC958]
MSEKWYVVKYSDKTIEDYFLPDSYVVVKYKRGLEKDIIEHGDTVVLITPSKEIAESTKRTLNEQL